MSTTQKRVRALVFILLGLGIALILNMTVWSGQAKATPVLASSDCSYSVGGRWSSDNAWGCVWEDYTSPDARQLYGNAATACGVGWAGGGPIGCGWAALGAAVGSIPWDGTWD
jgi:hypothetical protein